MSADGIWYVKLADGDVERVTLDQLDAAFQGGQIDENTMVLADGANQWMKLADLLGLSETPPPVAVPHTVAVPHQARAVPVPAPQPATYRPATHAAPMAPPPAPIPSVPVGRSLRPVSFDLGSDVDLGNIQVGRSSRKGLVLGAIGTFLVLGAGAFVVTKNANFSTTSSDAVPQFAAAAALAAPPASPPPEPVAPTPPTPQQPTLAGPSSVMDPTMRSSVMDPTKRLTDDQKKKLAEADKSSKSHGKAHSGGGGGSSHTREKSTSFTTDGNKFDPLNSSL